LDKYIFPEGIYCISCGALIDSNREYSLCDDCMENFRWAESNCCEICGRPVGDHHKRCADCMEKQRYFDKGFCCFAYGSREKSPVFQFKYGRKSYMARPLAQIMADKIRMEIARRDGEIFFDCIIPVPIHESRMSERGFNQAELLARFLSQEIGVAYFTDILVRQKNTMKMKGMDRVARAYNMEKAFAVDETKAFKIKGKRILLVDDIFTTGSTADEAAFVLKTTGAREVYLEVLTSGTAYYGRDEQ